LGERNKVLVRKKFSRAQLLVNTANLPSSLIGLEASAGAHFMGAALRAQGQQVRLIPAQFVKPYRKSNKNDFIDAEAIAEAVSKENMRFVQIKTLEQVDWQSMHRVRDRLVQRRTALINEIRGFLLERGITFAAEPIHLRKNLPAAIEDAEQNLSPRLRWLLKRKWQEWKQIEVDIKAITDKSERISNQDALCRRLRQIPGFGPLVSAATELRFAGDATSRPGSASCHGSTRPAASRSCWASASVATSICVACSSTVPAQYCFASSTTPEDSDSGCTGSPRVPRAIKLSWPSPISWLASRGPCCPAAKTIDISRCNWRQLDGRGKDAALGKA
jgi:transposase